MRSSDITTGHYVKIEQYPASAADRLLGRMVDFFFVSMYLTLAFSLVVWIEESDVFSSNVAIAVDFLLFLPAAAYFPLFELLNDGQTLGKRITGTKVVQVDGSQLQFTSAVLRWVLDTVDVYFGLGLPSIIFTHNNQRLGDLAAGTVVISVKENNYKQYDTQVFDFAAQGYRPTFPEASELSLHQVELIDRLLYNHSDFLTHDEYVRRLANKVCGTLDILPPQGMPADTFLQTVASDYRYYTSLPDLE